MNNELDVLFNGAKLALLEENSMSDDVVTIVKGSCYNFDIENQSFPLVTPFKAYSNREGGFVTVQGNQLGPNFQRKIRISVATPDDVRYSFVTSADHSVSKVVKHETDEQIIERIAERFEILDDMSAAVAYGDIRAMIVVGPPGVGKSFNVLKKIEEVNLLNTMASRNNFEVVKGTMTALHLYAKLHEFKDAGKTVVFDDCDSILGDELSLNILKSALDSGKRRIVHWGSDSRLLRSESIPNKFEFEGSVIFITNVDFTKVRSQKIRDHLDALQSRCHYIDLTLNTRRDCMLRIRQIAEEGKLFAGYGFSKTEETEILDWLYDNDTKLREVSLRSALKVADLKKAGANWQRIAKVTILKD